MASVLTGCLAQAPNGSRSEPVVDGELTALIRQSLPWPAIPATLHAASVAGPVVRNGSDTFSAVGNVSYAAARVDLLPASGQLAAAVYELPVGGFTYDAIEFDVTFSDPQHVWFGIADYRRETWQFTAAYPGITSVAPPYPEAHSPDGQVYFAVVAYDDSMVTVNGVELHPNLPVWQEHVIDDRDALGIACDAALIGGTLYAAFATADTLELRLARAQVPVPSTPSEWEVTVISTGDTINKLDLREINGLPAVLWASPG